MLPLVVILGPAVLGETTSTPIIVALIISGFSLLGGLASIVQTSRIARTTHKVEESKTDLADFQEMKQNWKDEITDLRAQLKEARDRIAALEIERTHLLEQLGLQERPPESRERKTDE